MMGRWGFVIGAVLLLAAPARAQHDDEAHGIATAGAAAFQAGRYDEALRYYQQAYELSQRPELLYNIGQAADRARDDATALDAFRRYLAAAPDAANRVEIEGRIHALERSVAEHATPPATPPAAAHAVGEACGAGGDCGPDAYCVQDASGRAFCTHACVEDCACPAGYHCTAAGPVQLCLAGTRVCSVGGATAAAPTVSTSGPTEVTPTTSSEAASQEPAPAVHRHWDPLFFGIGAAVFGAAWIADWAVTTAVCSSGFGCNNGGAVTGSSFIPVIGGIVAPAILGGHSSNLSLFYGLGITSALVQAAAIAFAAFGLTTYADDAPAASPTVSVGVSPLLGGASLDAFGRF
jgi:tetratricopeptide (TPR) repeat protein